MPNVEVSIPPFATRPYPVRSYEQAPTSEEAMPSSNTTHARKANIAHSDENRRKLAICAAMPARKTRPPISAVLTFVEMDNPPPAAWIKKVITALGYQQRMR